jgi:DNA-binding MarR family transcriptional regulator
MPRRLKISPLQRDIIVMLEEAGAETIGTVISTVRPSDESEFVRAVESLIGRGLVRKEETAYADGRSKTELVLTDQGRKLLGE